VAGGRDKMKIQDILNWLGSLARDRYPEDRLYEGDPETDVSGVLFCWMANEGARRTAVERGANLIVAHEAPYYETLHVDAGCPPPSDWLVNQRIRQFYREHRVGVIRSHRTLDAYCIPRVLAEHLGFPAPAVCDGHRGYEFTLVYDLVPQPFAALVRRLKERMGLDRVRASARPPDAMVRWVGMGWGGVSLSANLQYMELLRRHGVEVIIGGEVDEYALEYYRESGMDWIELGHYATEIIGIERASRDMSAAFPGLPVSCYRDAQRIAFA